MTSQNHILIQKATRSRFRKVMASGKARDLVEFHSDHKYLLMGFHQELLREMGALVAQPKETTIPQYEGLLEKILESPPSRSTQANALLHIFGYFKNDLTSGEKDEFLRRLKEYRQEKAPYERLLEDLDRWRKKFSKPYLDRQVLFDPFEENNSSPRKS